MVKKTILISLALLLSGILVAFFIVAPYHIYTLTLTEGVNTSFLEMKPSKKVFYDGSDIFFPESKIEDDSLFYQTHFSHFLMPLPLAHPYYVMIPVIKNESAGPRLGASFNDGKGVELFSFMQEKSTKLETISGNQKLFILPIFKNHIARKSEDELWQDLFYKKLSLPSNAGEGFLSSLNRLKSVTYSDLVYNLYVLYNREHIFPSEIKKISYDPESRHGLLEFPSPDPRYKVERIYLLDKGIIYPLLLKTRLDSSQAIHFREKMIKEIGYKESTPDSSIPIYAQYKNITYNHRIDQQGMALLYSAWSHDLANKDYVRVIILFLERGKQNLKYLKPFYEYAYKKFGTNLSSENELLLENADEKLKRKMKEELESEVKRETDRTNVKFEGNFNSNDDKVDFYLKKAKDSKVNSDEGSKVLLNE